MPAARRLAVVLFSVALFNSGLRAQTCRAFDVVSIKVNTTGLYGASTSDAKRFNASNQLMIELIMTAYGVSPLQISGIPSALFQRRYDIDATCDEPITKEQLPHLLQMVLADRFHLSVHREMKEQPVYALVLGKGGPKLHKAAHEDNKAEFRQRGNTFTFTSAEMSTLTGVLSQVTGRKVVDKTGLSGRYDFTLSYASNRAADREAAPDGGPDSVFTAVREELGLNLESQKSQVEFVIVDRLDPLIPN